MFELARLVLGRDHVAVPAQRRNLARPDEVIRLPEVVEEVVDLGELTVNQLKGLEGRWPLSSLVA